MTVKFSLNFVKDSTIKPFPRGGARGNRKKTKMAKKDWKVAKKDRKIALLNL